MSSQLKFSAHLKAIREAKNVKRADLAAFAQIKESYLEKLESGYSPPPSEEVIERLAKALKIDADELFALACKLPLDVHRMLLTRPALVQLVRIGNQWSDVILKAFLTARDVPAAKLTYVAGPLPCWDCDRSQREPIPQSIKLAVFRLDNHECVYCSNLRFLEVDHRYPDSFGGTNDLENLVTCCTNCNKKKRNRLTPPPAVFGRFRVEIESGER